MSDLLVNTLRQELRMRFCSVLIRLRPLWGTLIVSLCVVYSMEANVSVTTSKSVAEQHCFSAFVESSVVVDEVANKD